MTPSGYAQGQGRSGSTVPYQRARAAALAARFFVRSIPAKKTSNRSVSWKESPVPAPRCTRLPRGPGMSGLHTPGSACQALKFPHAVPAMRRFGVCWGRAGSPVNPRLRLPGRSRRNERRCFVFHRPEPGWRGWRPWAHPIRTCNVHRRLPGPASPQRRRPRCLWQTNRGSPAAFLPAGFPPLLTIIFSFPPRSTIVHGHESRQYALFLDYWKMLLGWCRYGKAKDDEGNDAEKRIRRAATVERKSSKRKSSNRLEVHARTGAPICCPSTLIVGRRRNL